MNNQKTAQLAKDARAATGMTQKAFAKMLRSGLRTIQNWESGEKPPNPLAQLVLEYIIDGWRPYGYLAQDEEK